MPGLSSSLYIGLSGLQAAQGALSVVGHNIANVNTPNFSRQRVGLNANQPQTFGSVAFGTGVNLGNITGMRDKFLEMQITQSTSRQQGAEVKYSGVEGISSVFQDDGTSGLSSLVQNFFQGFQQLSARPEDGALRTNLIGQAQSLVNGLKIRYQMLEDQRTQADQSIESIAKEVNTLTTQIAALNQRISAEPTAGADSDGRDSRQTLVNKLAGLVGIQVYEDSSNQLQISLDSGSAALVSGSTAYEMITTMVGSQRQVVVDRGGVSVPVTANQNKEGRLGANLNLRDIVLSGYQNKLDELAAGIVGQTNMIHRSGYDLSGTAVLGTNWQDFFQSPPPPPPLIANGVNGLPIVNSVAISAGNHYQGMVRAMTVNQSIVDDPSRIAAADAAGSPGNNGNARILANLQNVSGTVNTSLTAVAGPNGADMGNTGPYSSVISGLVSMIGTDVQTFKTAATGQDNLLSALKTQRDRVSAVDMDEEAMSLIAYQRSYQASARFISVIDQLTAQLLTQFGA